MIRKCYSKEKGNFWVATSNFTVSQLVLEESPLSSGILDEDVLRYCSCCFKYLTFVGGKEYTCGSCNLFTLCKKCFNQQVIQTHDHYCLILKEYDDLFSLSETPIYGQTTVYNRFFLQLYFRSQEESESESIQRLDNLVYDDLGIEEETEVCIIQFCKNIIPLLSKTPVDKETIDHYISLFKKAVYNWHAIPSFNIDNPDIGYALFTRSCLFNHDCSPTCRWLIEDGKFKAIALSDIREEQEVTISYFGENSAIDTYRRRDYLQDNYQFTCTCKRCRNYNDCFLCSAEAFYLCGKCKNIKYCSKKCQIEHWDHHKQYCCQ